MDETVVTFSIVNMVTIGLMFIGFVIILGLLIKVYNNVRGDNA